MSDELGGRLPSRSVADRKFCRKAVDTCVIHASSGESAAMLRAIAAMAVSCSSRDSIRKVAASSEEAIRTKAS